jgi:hypothetical protein
MITSRLFNSADVSFHCPTRFSKPSHRDVPESLRIAVVSEDSAGGVMISDAIRVWYVKLLSNRVSLNPGAVNHRVAFACFPIIR